MNIEEYLIKCEHCGDLMDDEKQELISTKVILNLQFKEITTKTTITDKNENDLLRMKANSKNVSNSGNSGKEDSNEPKN